MADYELTVILEPGLKEVDKKKLITKVEGWIKKEKGKVAGKKDWGMRSLAYPIKKNMEALYILMDINSEGNLEKELQEKMHLEGKILRYMLVRSLKQKNKRTKKH